MFPAVIPHWQARERFAGTGDWAVYLYNKVLRRAPRMPLPGRGSVTSVKLKDHPDPFHIRMGATDLLVLDEIFQTREYEFVEKALSKVQHIVDLGANVGFSLRYWHQRFPKAKILAVEPDPDNCRLCLRNVAAGQFSHQVTLVQACVGSHHRRVRLGGGEEWAYRMLEGAAGSDAPTDVLPLTELLNHHANGETIDLLKCDIEGAEQEVFRNCREWIPKVNAIVIELHPPYTPAHFLSDLKSAGARFNLIHQFSGKECPILFLQSANAQNPA